VYQSPCRTTTYADKLIHQDDTTMHYPHKTSKVKRARKIGFRARMATKKGRQAINRKRRVGRRVQVV
jgi:large subunit ribosomal protein L34